MASTSSGVFSATLQEITTTKLQELSKSRSDFETKKANALARLEVEENSIERLVILSAGVKQCFGIKADKAGKVLRHHHKDPGLEVQLRNLDSLLAQARHDPSVSIKAHKAWEASLIHRLDAQSLKYQYASLYAELVTEWLSSEQPQTRDEAEPRSLAAEEARAEELKQQARQQWEGFVFEPAKVDEAGLQEFLVNLFRDEGDLMTKRRALETLSEKITAFEAEMASPTQFNPSTLKWVIQGLLASDLLTDEKRDVLKSFKDSQVILSEISDVLNMRIAALGNWSWGESVPLEQTRKISGIYNIQMQEDVLQAIFLQYIGVKWSVFFKKALSRFRRSGEGPWKGVRADMTRVDKQRLWYYLGTFSTNPSLQRTRRRLHRANYFLSALLDSDTQQHVVAEGEEEANVLAPADHSARRLMMAAQAPPMPIQAASMAMPAMQAPAAMRSRNRIVPGRNNKRSVYDFAREPEDSETDDEYSTPSSTKSPMQAKQSLLHILSTEVAVNTRIHGEVTAFRTSFESWNSLLPHATVRTILKFFGVSPQWLEFFMKFLEAPLKFHDQGDSSPPRLRRRGTPASHVLSNVFGELVLFCLDFSVNQATNGSLLYRLFDDMWFWGPDHKKSVQAWEAIKQFTTVTGTVLDVSKSGTVRVSGNRDVTLPIDPSLPEGKITWGFLRLSPETGRFEINQPMVDQQVAELQKQLQDKSSSVFSFIQTWNTFAGTFFASNFGLPANCFGQNHVDMILETHSQIQREIFKAGSPLNAGEDTSAASVVDYLKRIIKERFNVSNVPDAWFFFPAELGGLDLQNPFIPTLQIRDSILKDPSTLLDRFEEDERDKYSRAKTAFERGDINMGRVVNRQRQRTQVDEPDWEPVEAEKDTFMSFEEYTSWREELSYNGDTELVRLYDKLLEQPDEETLELPDSTLSTGLSALSRQESDLRGILPHWGEMEPYWKWVAALYGPEVIERFGGLNIVDPGLLPMGMVTLFKDKRVKWQG